MKKRIGVLALQGDFAAHARTLATLGATVAEVRRPRELEELDGLVLPGGESTTLLNLMGDEPWFDALRSFHAEGGSFLATCAGTILLAREVTSPKQTSLAILDVVVERNAYGRQVDSFETTLDAPKLGGRIPAVFIRAPRLLSVGKGVETLASHGGAPVLVQGQGVLAMTFHPELTGDSRLHRYFLETVLEASTLAVKAS